jgi:rubrerythrin
VLSGRGFEKVFNLKGGIKAWNGAVVAGPAEVGMGLITGWESPSEMLLIAYAMEEGLRSFYQRMTETASDADAARLFGRLAAMDERHKEMIFELYREHERRAVSIEDLERRVLPKIMEGGLTTEEFLDAHHSSLETAGDVLILAMMLEAQALDLYLRYGKRSGDRRTREVLCRLADEEKSHLALLGNLQESLSRK